jgi:hypothetical protein
VQRPHDASADDQRRGRRLPPFLGGSAFDGDDCLVGDHDVARVPMRDRQEHAGTVCGETGLAL